MTMNEAEQLKASIAANLKPGDMVGPIIGEYVAVPAKVGRYSPDFVLWNGIVIEAKGYWRKEDQEKVRLVREQYPGLELRVVFEDASRRISKREQGDVWRTLRPAGDAMGRRADT
jgi:Phage endonuclease I